MPYAGSIDTARLDLEVFGADTEAVLTVRAPDLAGTETTPNVVRVVTDPDSGLYGQSWRARVPLPDAGLWWEIWDVTGTGEGKIWIPVQVGPGPGSDSRHTYATSTNLANRMGEAPPTEADRMLRDASALIDDLIMCAVYDVDDDGMPTDADVIAALRDAVCEAVRWWISTGDDGSGAAAMFQSASIAGVSLGRGSSGGKSSPAAARIGPAVGGILAGAGLLGHGPQAY